MTILGSIGELMQLQMIKGTILGPFNFEWQDEDTESPINLTGCSFIGQLRKDKYTAPVEATISFSITDAVNGKWSWWIPGAETNDIDLGTAEKVLYYGDIFVVSAGEKTALIRLEVDIYERVTEWA